MPDEPSSYLPTSSQNTDGAAHPHQPKNIVICCDGTGNEFGDANSNVIKLYTALQIDNQQVGYYHPGVGTMGDPSERHRIARLWSKVKGLAFAYGFKDNVFDAYRYLMETYNDGDQVYLFGFSRGSYAVRALAGLLDGYGLLCRGNEGHLPYAWRLYLDQHQDRKIHSIHGTKHYANKKTDYAAAFKRTFSHENFKIRFIGIWDTVSSVGWIYSPLRLFNVAQNSTVESGRHAISLDERRCFYLDNLWGNPLPGQDLMQVWFAGVHSDIGGSYPQEESGLSNITLRWMLNEARCAGVRLIEDRVHLVLGEPSSTYEEVAPLYPKPKHTYVHRSLKDVWWIPEIVPHIYYDVDMGQEYRRVPFGARRTVPQGSLIHHSVIERMRDTAAHYHPTNLKQEFLLEAIAKAPCQGVDKVLYYEYLPPKPPKPNVLGRRLVVTLFSVLDILLLAALLLLFLSIVVLSLVLLWSVLSHLIHMLAVRIAYG